MFCLLYNLNANAKSSSALSVDYFKNAVNSFESKTLSDDDKKIVIDETISRLLESADYQYRSYWLGVFYTFQCELKDKNRLIPFCIVSKLSDIKSLLYEAHQKYPEHYFYAPSRTLGIMYYKMPIFVGGSKSKALAFFKEAYAGAPEFSENKKWLSELL